MPLPPLSPSSDSLSAAMDEQHTWDLAVSNITDAVPRWEGGLAIGHLLLLDGGASLAAGHNLSSFASFAQQKGCTRRACAQQYLQCAQHDLSPGRLGHASNSGGLPGGLPMLPGRPHCTHGHLVALH